MSLRKWLGLAPAPTPAAETETVRKVVAALDHLEPGQARYIAAFGYILGRVAHTDLEISPPETAAMERAVSFHGHIPEQQAVIVVQMAKTSAQLLGGTENFLVTREFQRIATREQRMELLDCLFAIAAADEGISVAEDGEIRRIADELALDHRDYIQVRSGWLDRLNVMKDLPNP